MSNDGGQAFPLVDALNAVSYPGMTLRDYFAAKAMAAVIANLGHPKDKTQLANMAGNVYAIADAMLAERESK